MAHQWLEFGMPPVDTSFQRWLDAVGEDPSVPDTADTHVLYIKIRPDMTSAKRNKMIKIVEDHVADTPSPKSVNVTTFAGSWSHRLHDHLERCLRHGVALRVRVVDPDRCIDYTQIWMGWTSTNEAPLSVIYSSSTRAIHKTFVTLTFEGVTSQNLARISVLKNISCLTIRGYFKTWERQPFSQSAAQNFVQFLVDPHGALTNLEEVAISLDFQDGIGPILIALQKAISVRILRLTPHTSPTSLHIIRKVALAIQTGTEDLWGLSELVVPTKYVNANHGGLRHSLESKFDHHTYSLFDNKLVMFYNGAGLRLVYRRPLIFLPVKLF